MQAILHRSAPAIKPSPPRCPSCRGALDTEGDCPLCRASYIHEEAGRARRRRAELIGRMARTIGAKPDELIELIIDIAQSAGGAA